ncbi:hypothetical protein HPC62_02385 [Thermoleptolyngbya sichuanensis A183]|uniref:Uncharacterized protein n=1 Tax=Thermoleptolyngbya sichuanensis A183 TaxID=2737172 RepID=A0A6M8B300_9CYAN|nr:MULTISPECIES: hypothetical protein [Thermoleptolyngbya]MDG2618101.1 hypothetical protein [Thermoleptolyngbya sichuanensis XZ-Cy5]QKD81174.1 hypothetical protein HPC62_02385 [Thermoleptolyngbya sichuanensis A183]
MSLNASLNRSLKLSALSVASAVALAGTAILSLPAAASPCGFAKFNSTTTLTDTPSTPVDTLSQSPNANRMSLLGGGIAAIAALAGGAFALKAYRARKLQPVAAPDAAAEAVAEESFIEEKPFAIVVPAIALERPSVEDLDAEPAGRK